MNLPLLILVTTNTATTTVSLSHAQGIHTEHRGHSEHRGHAEHRGHRDTGDTGDTGTHRSQGQGHRGLAGRRCAAASYPVSLRGVRRFLSQPLSTLDAHARVQN